MLLLPYLNNDEAKIICIVRVAFIFEMLYNKGLYLWRFEMILHVIDIICWNNSAYNIKVAVHL